MRTIGLLALCSVLVCSCAQSRYVRTEIFKDRRLEIFLERATGSEGVPVPRGYSHPVDFEVDDLKYILATIRYQQKGLFGWGDVERVFNVEELYRMTPHLVAAFTKVSADDEVVFRMNAAKPSMVFESERRSDGVMFVKDDKLNLLFCNINIRPDTMDTDTCNPRNEYGGLLSKLVPGKDQSLVMGEKGLHYNWIEMDWKLVLEVKKNRERAIQRRIERHRTLKEMRQQQESGWEDWEPDAVVGEDEEPADDDVYWPPE
jgi:hypothetical protein